MNYFKSLANAGTELLRTALAPLYGRPAGERGSRTPADVALRRYYRQFAVSTEVREKILLLRAPIAPEEFAKPVANRTAAPTVAALSEQLTKPLKEMGYEVTDGGSIGPIDTFLAIGERAKKAGASMALVASPVGGLVGTVSVVKVSCAQISVRLFFIALDGTDLGKVEFASAQCDASADNAARLAGEASLSKVSAMLRKDNCLSATARKRSSGSRRP